MSILHFFVSVCVYQYRIILHCIASHHITLYRIISYRIVSYHYVSLPRIILFRKPVKRLPMLPNNWNSFVETQTDPNSIVALLMNYSSVRYKTLQLLFKNVIADLRLAVIFQTCSCQCCMRWEVIPLYMFSFVRHRWPGGTAEFLLLYRGLIEIRFCSLQWLASGEAVCLIDQLLTSP